ncbi:hypothetical protein MWMV10_MWMV10_03299 [Acinetobacter baumannii]|nr:hypothetical protein LV34_03544 [Acinetobacter baumannii]CAI4202620.1 hypothetical protein MWMV10_MWMV10_03299 [Acinetobacter baumannii]CAI4206149.1 hypothetical protein MWMV15_MWMV15_03284 [Acinetobacter baumannii]
MNIFYLITGLAILLGWHILYIHKFQNIFVTVLAGLLVLSFMIVQPLLPQVYLLHIN